MLALSSHLDPTGVQKDVQYLAVFVNIWCISNLSSTVPKRNDQDYLLYIVHCLSLGCLWIDLDRHMFSQDGYGPGTKNQGPKTAGPGPGGTQSIDNHCS